MSKKSIQRQQERKHIEQRLSRRQWIRSGIDIAPAFLGLGWLSYALYRHHCKPSFVEAYTVPSQRQAWLDGLEDRPYVTKKIVTPQTLEELKITLDYTPPKDIYGNPPFADTIALQKGKVCFGSKSALYVYPESCFDRLLSKFKEGLGKIIENVIEEHELLHADHFYLGIKGYPIKWFYDKNKKIHPVVFLYASEIVCHRKEFEGLKRMKMKDQYISMYQSLLPKLVMPYFQELPKITENQALLQKIRKEAWF